MAARSTLLPALFFLNTIYISIKVCYRTEHQAHSYDKSKKVLDINSSPVKSSVYVNGVSNRRGVWRVNYECLVYICFC
jgi:hypothetical protein